jgi:formate/nitrite transporter
MSELFGFDCYSPKEIAARIEGSGVTKVRLPLLQQVMLGVLAGAFIGLGAMASTVVASDHLLSFAITRVLGGAAFSLGLILVVVAGAELFTGNNLVVMSVIAGRTPVPGFLRHMSVIYLANLAGAVGMAALVTLSGEWRLGANAVGLAALRIASEKCAMSFGEAFFKGVLCNILVCLAVWLSIAGRSLTDKVLAVLFPVTAFVACGFEHSVANMYFIPAGMFIGMVEPLTGPSATTPPTWMGLMKNLVPVTLGNILGGAGLVGLVYWIIYRSRVEIPQKREP